MVMEVGRAIERIEEECQRVTSPEAYNHGVVSLASTDHHEPCLYPCLYPCPYLGRNPCLDRDVAPMALAAYPKCHSAVILALVHARLEVQMEEGHCFLDQSVDAVQRRKRCH